ncbi:hypothetical protein BC827DRAFT_1220437 [Russula dissimulans]|nr:hypothetical protein BC827DRAFT_1220437 [Russula dissimulans]
MAPSLSLALIAFLQRARSLRRDLKSFVLRCLLLWPRILRNLRNLWSLYFQTGSIITGRKKTGGDAEGPSSTITIPKREGYTVICASQTFDRVGEASPSRSISRSGDIDESTERGTDTGRAPSVISFPVPYRPSLELSRYDSPQHSSSSLPARNVHTPGPSNSSRAGSPLGTRELIIDWSPDPLPGDHLHATSRQFTGAYPHTRSRSPSPSLFRRRSPSPIAGPELGVNIPLRPVVIQESHGSPETPAFPIAILPPSRSATEDSQAPYRPSRPSQSRPSPVHGQTQSFSTRHDSPSAESASLSVGSSRSRGHSPSVYGVPARGTLHTYHSRGSIDGSSLAPPQIQGIPQSIFSMPQFAASRVFLMTNASGTQPGTERRTIKPMHSDQVSRYTKKGGVQRVPHRFTLETMHVDIPHSYKLELDSDDWVPIIHPGGALYFYHKTWRIFTDVYMYNPDLRAEVYEFAEQLKLGLEEKNTGRPPPVIDYDIVLDIVETKDKKTNWKYYYVDHKTRTLFWLQPYDMSELMGAILGVKEPGHIKLRLEALYWVHWSLYPIGSAERQFPADAAGELLGTLLSSSIDSLTSTVSTAPYSVADMQTMYGIIKEAKELGPNNDHAINSIARLLSVCALWRFVHFHGQETSRQHRYKSIYNDDPHKRTMFFQLLFSPALFFTPDVHLRELRKVWADEIIIEDVWRKFMQRLVSEWEEFVLYSTVMLATNVAFLAIQAVIIVPTSGWINPSAPQIASSISLLFSIGSIITGLLLIRRNRTMAVQGAEKARDYLSGMKKPVVHLEPLAIIFSLTYALLMWSVCLFFVALLLFSFQNTKRKIQISVGAVAAAITALIFWSIWNSWDSGDRDLKD